MPVRLNTIPDAESYPAPPARIKWLSALLLMLSVGVAITSLFASDELAKNGPHFWGLACGVPAFIWSLVASVRWLFFITQYIRADAWNKRREEVILQETRRGRRALQILSFSVQTALNGDSVAETTAAFLARQQVLNTYVDLRGEDTVRRSVIPVLTNKPVTGRLSEIISRLFIDIRPQLFLLPPDFHINVLLEIDAPLSGASVRTIWQDEWQKAGLPEARLFSAPEPGLAAVDDWLDNFIQEKAVLLVISVYLEPKTPERTAESSTALLLANRLTQTALTPLALLHRPERITDTEMMASGIAQALDWMAEQYGKNEMALLLLEELDTAAQGITLTQWEPELLFEVKARQLKLLRLRAHRYADKALLNRKMEILLGTLVTIDPVRAAVLCDTQHKD
ncbi:type VI secretion system domain-containing protein [Escherichia coli]